VAYKVSQIIRSDKDYSFDIMNEENLPLVHFLYLRESDAIASAKQVRVAVAKAKLIKAGRRLKTGLRTGRPNRIRALTA
jgi:hypothetical protein